MKSKYAIRKQYPHAKFGMSRAYIPLDENTGMKIPYTQRGIEETEKEKDILFNDWFAKEQYSDILPKGIEELENGYIVEHLQPITAKIFQQITGLKMGQAFDSFRAEENGWKYDNEIWENEWWASIVDFCHNYDYCLADVRKANLRTDGIRIVLIDFALNSEQLRKERCKR